MSMDTHIAAGTTGGRPLRAVVTGASSGIGLHCCKELLAQGWEVIGLDVADHPLATPGSSAMHGLFRAINCDISHAPEVASVFASIASDGRPLDALVCSAGILRGGPVLSMSEQDFDAVFDINTRGSWLTARAAVPLMRDSTRTHGARIVFVASAAAIRPKIGAGAYAASKVALIHLARVMAVELASSNILVNVVAPATVDTPFVQRLPEGTAAYKVTGNSPLGRVAQTQDVVNAIRFLLDDGSSYMTGSVLTLDGGTTAAFVP
jgi:NAD(P)-dependent dehydrogenase (short-subunit alcohol dehydrogenase family)